MSEFSTREPTAAQWQTELVRLQSELARERPRAGDGVVVSLERAQLNLDDF